MPSPSPNHSPRSHARITQHRRLLQLDSPLGPDVLLPQRLIATERLNAGYEVTIDLLTTHTGLALEQLISQPVTLWIRQHEGETLPWHGYVHTAKRLGSDGEIDFFQLTFSPWLHFLRFRKDARIWQDKRTEDILADVFNNHPQARGHYRFVLERTYVPRSYCTQYETDWHFVQRLMEEEGWFAHHEQREDGSGHVLVITDNTWNLPGLPQQGIAFHGAAPRDELDKILHWSASRTLSSKTWRGRSDDYKSPRMQKEAEEQVMPEYGHLPAQLLSTSGRVEIRAKEEVLITAGGSFIRLNASGITQGTSGAWEAKAATHSMPGPTTLAYEMNKSSAALPFDEEFVLRWPYDQSPVKNRRFEIVRGDGTKVRGVTDAQGKTGLQKSLFVENTSLRILPE